MNPRNSFSPRLILVAATALLLAACQATLPGKPAGEPEPKIVSASRVNGKGIPNGRSDSSAPFLRGGKLQQASDPEYGYSYNKPIRTGPADSRVHILFLNTLRGPKGEVVTYERKGACCEFVDKTLPFGGGLLDVYLLKMGGRDEVITLYVDMYKPGAPLLPAGFTARQ